MLLQQDWRARIAHLTEQLEIGLAPARDLPGVSDVRVLGAIGVVEMVEPVELSVVQPRLAERGAWVRPFGRLVYTMPPYVSTDADLAIVTSAIVGAVSPQE